jgi:prepilin-type N-terminal cleavage/methylation domain-containing protein
MNRFPRPSRCRTRGFTLLEMMITLAIFILLVGAVFGLMTGVLESTSTLQDSQNRREQMTALNTFLRNKLTTLPARYSVVSYERGAGEGLTQDGVIYGNASAASAVDAKMQANGFYTLRVCNYAVDTSQDAPQDARQVLQQMVTSDDPTLVWTPLLADVKTLDWKFQDNNATDWVEIWNSGTKPNLIEFTLQAAADIQPVTMDFWLPPIQAPTLGAARQAARTSTTAP